tara:strand:+ start:427 stop:729 length:303 start_codon:yes stop_codon:yes gene_type:complete
MAKRKNNFTENFKNKITTSGKKFKEGAKGVLKKTTSEQKFLGKTLPKALFKVGKFAFTNPISFTALTLAPSAIRAVTRKGERVSRRSPGQTFDKKGRWML